MNFLKRALLSVKRHKVKNFLLTIAFTLIASMLLCSLVISTASEQVRTAAMKNIGAQVQMTSKRVDYILPDIPEPKNIYAKTYNFSDSLLSQLQSLKHVDSYNQMYSYCGVADNFKTVSGEQDQETLGAIPEAEKLLTFLSVTNSAKLNEFATNTYTLVAGRPVTKDDTGKPVAVINENLAKLNNIKVSDTIKIKQVYSKNNTVYSFKVVGIFKAPEVTDFEKGAYGTDPGNLIYTSDNSNYLLEYSPNMKYEENMSPDMAELFEKREAEIKKIDPDYTRTITLEEAKGIDRVDFYLDDPSNIASFEAAAKKIPGMENFNQKTDSDLYVRVTAPVKAVGIISNIMSIIMLVAGCIILSLIVILSLKGRRREFGILLAIGEKKLKIMTQVFFETLIPIFVAFILAIMVSSCVSQAVCNKLVDSNVKSMQQPTDQISQILNNKHSNRDFNTNNAEPLTDISVSVTPGDIGKFAGFGLLIVLISVAVPVVRIIRLSPMNVLTRKE